jgi:GxxExxY protein
MEPQRTLRKSVPRREERPPKAMTERITSCIREVHSALGPGLLETVYEEALAHEFMLQGLRFVRQKEAKLSYKGKEIGWHRVDFLVEDEVVVELKSVERIHGIHEAQLIASLRSLDKRKGLLANMNVVRLSEGIKRILL